MTLDSQSGASSRWSGKRLVEGDKWLVVIVVSCLGILDMSYSLGLVLLAVVSNLHYHRAR
jgi:hypothetical protein